MHWHCFTDASGHVAKMGMLRLEIGSVMLRPSSCMLSLILMAWSKEPERGADTVLEWSPETYCCHWIAISFSALAAGKFSDWIWTACAFPVPISSHTVDSRPILGRLHLPW